jgi:hypothetical protein
VTWAVNVSVVTDLGVIFNVSSVDGDTTSLFFRRAIDAAEISGFTTKRFCSHSSQSSSQRGFAMVNVTNGANVDVREGTFKFFFSHDN